MPSEMMKEISSTKKNAKGARRDINSDLHDGPFGRAAGRAAQMRSSSPVNAR